MKSPTLAGHEAETLVVDYLVSLGFQIMQRNWRTRVCEIDIVAKKQKSIYFVEVKFRGREDFGNGLEYITRKKLQQMRFAAEVWVLHHRWNGDYSLAAAAVNGHEVELVVID